MISRFLGNPIWKTRSLTVFQEAVLWGFLSFFIYFLFVPYLIFVRGEEFYRYPLSGNEQSHVALARAIVEKGSFQLDSIGYKWGDLASNGGHLYSNKPPGFALLLTPVYSVFYHFLYSPESGKSIPHFLFFVPLLLGSLSVFFCFSLAREMGLTFQSASISTVVCGFGTILMVYSTQLTNNVATTCFGLGTLFLSIRFYNTGKFHYAPLVAFFASYTVVVNYSGIVLVFPSLLLFLISLVRYRDKGNIPAVLGTCLGVAMLPLGFLAYYHYRCFDSIFETGYSNYNPPPYIRWETPGESYRVDRLLQGLWGLTFGPAKGIFVHTPILLFAVPGFYFGLMKNSSRVLHLVIGSTVILYIALFAPYRYWFGGHSIGARHVLPILPMLAVYVGFCFSRVSSRIRIWMVILLVPSVIVHVLLALAGHIPFILDYTWQGENGPLENSHLTHLYSELVPQIIRSADILPFPGTGILGRGLFKIFKIVSLLLAGIIGFSLLRLNRREEQTEYRTTSGLQLGPNH